MCYYDKKTYDKNGFNIEVYPMLIKPSDGDFSTSAHGLAIQCGADFHVSYQGKFSSKPKLGILRVAYHYFRADKLQNPDRKSTRLNSSHI